MARDAWEKQKIYSFWRMGPQTRFRAGNYKL